MAYGSTYYVNVDQWVTGTSANNLEWKYQVLPSQEKYDPTPKHEKWLRGRVKEICDLAKFPEFQ